MLVHRNLMSVYSPPQGASCAMGNFDGVHLGHQAVIDMARTDKAPLGIITFEPHPRQFFSSSGSGQSFRLMNPKAKAHQLEKLGVKHLYEIDFNDTLVKMTPEVFAKEILSETLGISQVVVGADFRFGKERSGTAEDLELLGKKYDFNVLTANILKYSQTPISSTAVRQALRDGKPRDARDMLGHWHRIEGPVLHGKKRGRELGYPTANISLEELHLPRFGVYAVQVDILGGHYGGSYPGAASLGVRPTFGENQPNLEIFIFDFNGDIYGQDLSVALIDFIRPEKHFESVDSLIDYMKMDCEKARHVLAAI